MNDYVKIVYQSEPIGRDRIILYLTTFDIEAFNENVNLDEIPAKKKSLCFYYDVCETDNPDFIDQMEQNINRIVRNEYDEQLKEAKRYIEALRKIKEIEPIEYSAKIENKGWTVLRAKDWSDDDETDI